MVDLNWQRYPVYKSSGVEWLGDIPEHWEVRRLKFVSHLVYGDSLGSENREDGNINVYGSNGIIGLHSKSNTLYPVIIVGRKGSFGKVQYSLFPCFCIDTAYFIDSRTTKQNLKWLYYALQILELDKISQDTGVPGLSREKAYQKLVPIPPLPEQQAIANFLDHKIAQIDEYIAKKQRMIKLLKEQKTVIINQAVTKGLNPDIPMKDSGIEWLGEIPEHWEVKRLKYVSHLIYGSSLEAERRENGNINVYGSNGIIGLHSKANTLSPVIIVGRKGSFGKVQYSLFPCFCIDTAYFIDSRTTKQNLKWLYYALQILELDKISQDTGVPGLSREKAYQKLAVVPPISEQQEIVSFIEKKSEKINRAIATIEKEIKLIQEYRTTLISETVTGKIDVRKYRPTHQKTKTKTSPQ